MNESDKQEYIKESINLNEDVGGKKRKRKVIIVLTLFIVLLILLVIFFLFFRGKGGTINKMNVINNKPNIYSDQAERDFDTAISSTYKLDKDFDGLTDDEEKKYGTSPTSSDTDGDGLTDSSEIKIYKSNP